MSDSLTIDLFVEDRAHEEFLKPLVERLAHDENLAIELRVRAARGGHGRALEELAIYQRAVAGGAGLALPDLLVVAIDGNCQRPAAARAAIEERIDTIFAGRVVVACPDPHVERWYLVDPESFEHAVGTRPHLGKKKCERGRYKGILAKAISDGGHPVTLGGIEFAREIVDAMDLYRAGKAEASFKHFLDGVKARLTQLRGPLRGRGA